MAPTDADRSSALDVTDTDDRDVVSPGDDDRDAATASVATEATPAVVTVGGALVDRYYRLSNLPEPDGGAYVRATRTGYGGVAANVACASTRLGRSAGIVTRVGTDAADAIAADLADYDVDTTRLVRGPEETTYCMVLQGPTGERMAVTGGESARALRIEPADLAYLAAADAVFLTAYVPDRAARSILAARAAGHLGPTVFDLSGPLPELENRGVRPATVDEAVATADLFVVGEVALRSYCASHDRPVAAAPTLLRERGITRAALTHGADGATLLTPEETVTIDAYAVDVTDTTGAGDAFVAGLIDAWVLGDRSPRAAGRHAAAVAALNCTADGARGRLPSAEAVARFRAAHDHDRDRDDGRDVERDAER